jgi:hypothetical protein
MITRITSLTTSPTEIKFRLVGASSDTTGQLQKGQELQGHFEAVEVASVRTPAPDTLAIAYLTDTGLSLGPVIRPGTLDPGLLGVWCLVFVTILIACRVH